MTELSLWQKIMAALEEGVNAVWLAFLPRSGPDSVAFSISFIALAAKLAKADGVVTRDEVTMFRQIFEIPPEQEANAARVYNLCRQETTGFETYARQLSGALARTEAGDQLRRDVIDGLFHIAMADGVYNDDQDAFLRRVAEIFGLNEEAFLNVRARHVPELWDPWLIVGLSPSATHEDLRARRRAFMRENHPDKIIARGLPQEMIELANLRLVIFQEAYKAIEDIISHEVFP